MLSERMKVSFGISDATLGLLQGPVTVVAYVIVGIPLARGAESLNVSVAAGIILNEVRRGG